MTRRDLGSGWANDVRAWHVAAVFRFCINALLSSVTRDATGGNGLRLAMPELGYKAVAERG